MRAGGGTHKSGLERSLAAARAQASQAIDTLDAGGNPEDPEQLRTALTNIEKALRSAEIQLSSRRLHEGDHATASSLDPRVLEWVKASFTDEDHKAASQISDIETSESLSPASRRRSDHQILKNVSDSPAVSALLDRAGRFDFDALAVHALSQVQTGSIAMVGLHLATKGPNGDLLAAMQQHNRFADVKAFQQAITNFFQKIDGNYKPEALYHGSVHAIDVMSTSAWFMASDFVAARTNPLERFMTLVASAIHDVGHMGRNNMFYTKTMHALAVTYNDQSVLENMHLARSFELMKEHKECNWFELLTDSQQYVRKGLITMVLATDPTGHAKHMKHFRELVEEVKEDPGALLRKQGRTDAEKQHSLDGKMVILANLLHAADISNPTKPQHMMLRWTERLLQEFWAQGDEERDLGVAISPLCDRGPGMTSVPKGQIGFVSFVIEPFFKLIAEPILQTKEALDQLALNVEFWKGKEGSTYEQIFDKAGEASAQKDKSGYVRTYQASD